MKGHRLVFVGGLHRSGTTLLARSLASHPAVSGFAETGAPADEGQHLQSVYPPAKAYGGPGRFGFAPELHLTEDSPLVSGENRRRLFEQWSRYWDLDKEVLLEKSPPNLTKTRFLQALFPEASFVVVLRHPVPVTLATARWRGTRRYGRLIHHWLRCHELFEADRPRLERAHVLTYEQLVADPAAALGRVYAFLGIAPRVPEHEFARDSNSRYFEQWEALRRAPLMRAYLAGVELKCERQLNRFGYSLRELERYAPAITSS